MPFSGTDSTDLALYQSLETHLMTALQTNANMPNYATIGLTTANITEVNDTIAQIQLNIQAIVNAAAFIDITPPTVANYFPADNAVDVPIDSSLVLIFNEAVQKGIGNILIRENGITTQTIDVTSGSVTVNNNVVTINPTNFTLGVTVSIKIDAGAIKDLSNIVYTGIGNDTTWNFNTPAP